jgi:transcriptional regulator with XRE-family HTH domain
VARKNPVSQLEQAICRRLRECRLATSLSQVAFAKLLGIDSNRLSSYEHGRVPVRFGMALQAARLARVSLRWLAEGTEPKKWPIAIGAATLKNINDNELFSEAYQKWIKPIVDKEYAEHEAVTENFKPELINEFEAIFGPLHAGYVGTEDVAMILDANIRGILENIPPHLYSEFFRAVFKSMRQFQDGHLKLIQEFKRMKHAGDLSKQPLTIEVKELTSEGVKPVMPKLIERLNKATEKRGSKAALAKWLGVHRQSVTDWLSGKQEPGGEITLKMLHWVEQRERQK